MKLEGLSTLPKQFSRQVAAYEAAGLSPDMETQVPFAANAELFLNFEALKAAKIDPMGLARQMDQVLIENLGNNLSQKVKAAVKKGTDLPDQSVVDAMLAAYDFTGVRMVSEEGMSTEERTIIAEIRKAIRSLISGGSFASLGSDGKKTKNHDDVAFDAVRIQTGPEAEGKPDKDGNPRRTPPGSVPAENYEAVVAAAYSCTEVELEDGNGNSATLDFSVPASFNEHGQPTNLTGVVEAARQEAARILERNRAKAVAPVEIQISL
jgi:hypothetical protein